MWRAYASLAEPENRHAFVRTLRAVIDPGGQTVCAADRLYLAAAVPTLILWGDQDDIIPVAHARAAHELMPESRLEIFEGAGHFLHVEQPQRFAETLHDFVGSTEPAARREQFRETLARAGEDRTARELGVKRLPPALLAARAPALAAAAPHTDTDTAVGVGAGSMAVIGNGARATCGPRVFYDLGAGLVPVLRQPTTARSTDAAGEPGATAVLGRYFECGGLRTRCAVSPSCPRRRRAAAASS
jgi:hypothetical protein